MRYTLKTKKIHPTAIIEDSVVLGNNVEVGPYTVIEGNTTIGDGTKIGPFCHLGRNPQDRKYSGETTTLKIGKNCRLSEYVVIESGVEGNVIGDECFFMSKSGVSHDTIVGNGVTFSVFAVAAGKCLVEDNVFFGMYSSAHQKVRVGRNSMIGGNSFITRDVLPYSLVEQSVIRGVNLVGMRRAGFDNKSIKELTDVYKKLLNKEMLLHEWINFIDHNYNEGHMKQIVEFARGDSKRSFLIRNENV